MSNLMITLLILIQSQLSIEDKIKKLMPETKPETAVLISETLTTWMPKVGLNDVNLILALIYKESSFMHMYTQGESGEWGMLQVIPSDDHIQKAALKYRCTEAEQKASFVENDKTFKLCRCRMDETTNCDLPDVGSFYENKYIVSIDKLKRFLKYSPRGALVTGLYELKYWKNKFDKSLKTRYWTIFPKWLFPSEEMTLWESWWKTTKSNFGENVWIVHHNYGGVIKRSHAGRWYPRMVYKQYTKLNKMDI